jgi:hypothetical protein
MNATTSNLRMRIEGECYFHMPPGALLKVILFELYKHVCITFQPTLVINNEIGNTKNLMDNIEIKYGSDLTNPQLIADKFNSHLIDIIAELN